MRKPFCVILLLIGIAIIGFGVFLFVYELTKEHTTFLYALLSGIGICFMGFIIGLIGFVNYQQIKEKRD